MLRKILSSVKHRFNVFFINVQLTKKNVKIASGCKIGKSSTFEGANRVGEYTIFSGKLAYGSYIGPNSNLYASIGRFCSIASNVDTLSGTHPSTKFVSTSPMFFSLLNQSVISFVTTQKFNENILNEQGYHVTIGNDVWIGQGAKILGGVEIGDGAIIAAYAVVTKNVEPYTIVGGIPAKYIRKRFNDEQIDILLKFKWWDKSIDWIKKNADIFDDIDRFIEMIRKSRGI